VGKYSSLKENTIIFLTVGITTDVI